jgi:D-alanine-D-alanine ligase
MKVAVVFNRDSRSVINLFGQPNREKYGLKTIRRIIDALKRGGHQAVSFEGDKDLIRNLEEFMPRTLKGERPGMVFNLSYGIQGQARYTHVPGILEMVGIPYVGSGPLAHSLSLDKVVAKMLFRQAGLPTPDFAVLESRDDEVPPLTYPLIVKPKNESTSFGIRVVQNEAELREAAGVIFDEFNQPVLVEQFIDGREINVGLLGNSPPEVLPPAELLFGDGPRIYTLEDKRQKSGRTVEVQCPADLSADIDEKARSLARKAFQVLGCVDCARVDMRLDDEGNLYILEINSLPSLGEHGSFTHAAEAVGLDYPALVNRLVDEASARYFGTSAPPNASPKDLGADERAFAYLTQRRDRIEKRLEEWTARGSRTDDPVGLRAAMGELDRTFKELGLSNVVRSEDDAHASLWTTPAGVSGGTLLVAHLDVPLPREAMGALFRRDPEWLHGEGIGSSRAPLVAIEWALRALKSQGALKKTKLGVLVHTDEGQGCRYSKEVIRRAAADAAQVLVMRPGLDDGGVVTGRRGLRRYQLTVERPARRLGRPSKKPDALTWLAARIPELVALSDKKGRVGIGVTAIDADAYPLHLPHRVTAEVLVSYGSQRALDSVAERLDAALREKGVSLSFEVASDRPPMVERAANTRLAARFAAEGERWEIAVGSDTSSLPSAAGLVPEGVPVLCGVGPVALDLSTPQERVQRISLIQRALVLSQLLVRSGDEK